MSAAAERRRLPRATAVWRAKSRVIWVVFHPVRRLEQGVDAIVSAIVLSALAVVERLVWVRQ